MALFTGLEPSINMQGKHTKCNLQLNNIKITIELLDSQVSFIEFMSKRSLFLADLKPPG